jgi:hypothetical protein
VIFSTSNIRVELLRRENAMEVHFGPCAVRGQGQAMGDNPAVGATLGFRVGACVVRVTSECVEVEHVIERPILSIHFQVLVFSAFSNKNAIVG